MDQAKVCIGVVNGKIDHETTDKIIKFMEDNVYGSYANDVTIMEVDSEGNPIPETAQKLGDIATIELTPVMDPIDIQALYYTETIDPVSEYNPEQKHYDETHSRKAKWHKRYF